MIGRDRIHGVAASYPHLDSLIEAVHRVREAGHSDLEVFSPAPSHDLEHAVGGDKSPVRFFTFDGAVTGLALGFFMAITSSWLWDMIVDGKPIVAIPAFVVLGFELTILIGALANLLGVLWLGGVPAWRHPAHDPRFTDDRFGLFVAVPRDRIQEVAGLLSGGHADRMWRIDGGERAELPRAAAGGEA